MQSLLAQEVCKLADLQVTFLLPFILPLLLLRLVFLPPPFTGGCVTVAPSVVLPRPSVLVGVMTSSVAPPSTSTVLSVVLPRPSVLVGVVSPSVASTSTVLSVVLPRPSVLVGVVSSFVAPPASVATTPSVAATPSVAESVGP